MKNLETIEGLTSELTSLSNIKAPESSKDIRQFGKIIENATEENPLVIFVGSCPWL